VVEEEAIEEIIEVINLIDSMEDLIIKQDKIIKINGIQIMVLILDKIKIITKKEKINNLKKKNTQINFKIQMQLN
jgi:hypothetical protein